MVRLKLNADQVAEVAPHLQPGKVLLGRVIREPFDGTNAESAGSLEFELGYVPAQSIPTLREAIRKANAPKKARPGRRKNAITPETENTP